MKLESLILNKFKDSSLKKEQMFLLNGGGTETPGGCNMNAPHGGRDAIFDYAYDSERGNGITTFHGRSAVRYNVDDYY